VIAWNGRTVFGSALLLLGAAGLLTQTHTMEGRAMALAFIVAVLALAFWASRWRAPSQRIMHRYLVPAAMWFALVSLIGGLAWRL
jgi:hypothetical protein